MTFNQKTYFREYYLRNCERIKLRNRAWTEQNPKARNKHVIKSNEKNRLAKSDPRKRAEHLWRRARKQKKEFTITLKQIEELLLKITTCPYTHIPFDYSVGAKGERNPWAPSIDRKDNSKGYTLNNIEIVSFWWNCAKNSWPPEVMVQALSGLRGTRRHVHTAPINHGRGATEPDRNQ